jgi:uncharacterized protein
MGEAVGTVATLTRFPVKSMQGETLSAVELTAAGLVGDRAYALVETETGKVLSGKHSRLGTQLMGCRAEYVKDPAPGDCPTLARITLSDGTSVTSGAPDADARLSAFFGCEVTLQRAGPFFDLFAVSVLTTSTLAQLQALRPESRFDARRFRMNIVVESIEEGFVENGWTGRSLQIGAHVRLTVALPDPRCVMTTRAQDDLPEDTEILRTLVRHNRLEVAGGLYPCAGVYAVVDVSGTTRAGDRVSVAGI